ncbi:MAG TPA: hypothetical protein VG122_13715 [Gemmata sp.]|nr:hypothetical protein [Gemmata sp.]
MMKITLLFSSALSAFSAVKSSFVFLSALCVLGGESFFTRDQSLFANPPAATYIFPAGGQRGTTVPVRAGGLFLYDQCEFDLSGRGITASPTLRPMKRLWFEGPLLPLPESQQQEDYPADMTGTVTLAKDANLGPVRGRVFTSQGGAGGLVFMVGDLPEVVEKEIDGEAIPQAIKLPVTANGRIFPRENVDLWEFDGEAGKTITAFVYAQALNSPLVPQLDILDSTGKIVAEQMQYPVIGTDGSVKFTPKVAGKYRVRITDARTLGGPAYVYRLTVTTANVPAFNFPVTVKPDGLKDAMDAKDVVKVPIALNGRIEKPTAINEWKVELKKGGKYTFDLQARRAESPLCGVMTILDTSGKELARAESGDPSNDPAPLAFSPQTDGIYTVRVAEKFRGRGGPNFIYRLRVTDGVVVAGEPGFRLTMTADVTMLARAAKVNVPIAVERLGGFSGPIELSFSALPKGVTIAPVKIEANQSNVALTIQADATAAIGTIPLIVMGTATIDGKPVQKQAVVPGNKFLFDEPNQKLTIAFPTPFKIIDQYVMTSAPRGETYRRKYTLDRAGFDGPIRVELADKQARHLQGVTGPVLIVPPGQTEIEYPAFLPPWMELGRTCRVCVMATAKVKDPVDGREHMVSFSSTEQNQQMIVVVSPGRLDLDIEKTSIRAEPGSEVRIALKVSRSKNLKGDVKVEVVLPDHWKGLTAVPLLIPATGETGEMVLKFAKDCGPFNAPLLIRATAVTPETPIVAEAKMELVR